MSDRNDEFFLPFAHPSQRVGVLLDTTNLYHAARSRFGGRLDYRRLVARIVGPRVLVRAVAYVTRAEDVNMRPFIEALLEAGITARVKVMPRGIEGTPRTAWDVGIALEAAQLVGKVDALALVSGSPSLADVAGYTRAMGVRSEVYAVDANLAPEMVDACDVWRAMDESWLLPGRRRPTYGQDGYSEERDDRDWD